jgi:hypothetical protein
MSTPPKLGTRRQFSNCRDCGEALYERYDSYSCYHNDSVEEWRGESHERPASCIRYLAACVKRLSR